MTIVVLKYYEYLAFSVSLLLSFQQLPFDQMMIMIGLLSSLTIQLLPSKLNFLREFVILKMKVVIMILTMMILLVLKMIYQRRFSIYYECPGEVFYILRGTVLTFFQ